MTELEKLDAGLPYDIRDPQVRARKQRAIEGCARLAATEQGDAATRQAAMRALLGSVGEGVIITPGFRCDNGRNIHVGDDILINYNAVILDVLPVHIGSHVMIGPNTLITTVGHPLSPKGRRQHLGITGPVRIGDDVWIGGSVTILPGVTIGNNVVIAAGAVVNRDIPDNSLAAGVPARVIRTLDNDLDE